MNITLKVLMSANCLPQVRLDQPRAPGRVAIPPKHQRDSATHVQPHVPLDPQRPGRGHAGHVQVNPWR